MRKLPQVVVVLGLLAGTAAWADQVTLTNGDRLTGRILELDAEALRFQTELLGEVTIPRIAIISLAAEQELAVTLPDERTVRGMLVSRAGQVDICTESGDLTVGLSDLRAVRTAEEQEKYEQSLRPRWYQNWELGVNAALSARGGGGTTRLTLGVDAARRTLDDELTFDYLALHETEKSGSVVNDNKSRATIFYLHRWTQQLYYFGAGDFDHDALQNLRLRAVQAGGVGWRWKETKRTTFDLVGGGALNSEYFQDRSVRRSGEAVVGEHLRWQMTPRTFFEERVLLFPNLSHQGEYRVQVTSKLETRINTWLSWYLNFSTHYLSDPPPETKKNDMLLTSGIRLTFGRPVRGGMRLRK